MTAKFFHARVLPVRERLFNSVARASGVAVILCAGLNMPALADMALVDAARAGDIAAIARLLAQGESPDSRSTDGTTALHWTVLDGGTEAVSLLLEAGADPAAVDRYGISPLYLAAQNGSVEIVAGLLEAGADPNAMDPAGESALMTAARTGNVDVLELLIQNGALLGWQEPAFDQTALMMAARENHPELVALLIRHGAKTDVHTRVGSTPPFIPPCKGGCGSEGVGINRGGVPDRGERDSVKGGMTPLLYAARDGYPEVARVLLDAGADIELTEANEITPLLMALINNRLDVASLLLERGAAVNVEDFYGRTPLFAAVNYRNLDLNSDREDKPTDNGVDREPVLQMIRLLLEHGADVDARTREHPPQWKWLYALNDITWVDFTGQTAFLRAALAGDVTTMKLLLEYGADPHIPTYGGTTPLMAAAGMNWVLTQTYTESKQSLMDAVKLCLALGADINAANSMGLTALLAAVNRGSNDIIRLLVAEGARLDVKDNEGQTPLRWAEGVFLSTVGAERKPETIALLEELMAGQAEAAGRGE